MNDERSAFAERIRVQLLSRYPGADVEVDAERFSVHMSGDRIEVTLPHTPLYNAVQRDPSKTPMLITEYIANVERQLTPRDYSAFAMNRVLWCVRTEAYLKGMARAHELLRRPIAADLVAFIAEELPGAVMRGVPREDWRNAGSDDDAVASAAEKNTAERFARLIDRIHSIDRIPADGWRMAGDALFQGSVLLAPAVLRALSDRACGEVLLAVPDRGVLLAMPSALPAADRFTRRVLREWRESMNPCSREILETDGSRLRGVGRQGRRATGWVMPWLQE